MTPLLDTSVVIASLDADEPHHAVCDRLLSTGGHRLFVHALAETFSILTGSRIGRRLGPDTAAELIASAVLPFVELVHLTGREMMMALTEAPRRGARGGAVYDWLHLVAARKAGVDALVTIDRRDFMALTRPGDPAVRTP
jgi:predicted nucleic acid-binding protein